MSNLTSYNKKRVLWINHFVPYPAKGGLLIRTHGLLETVIKEHHVTIACLIQPRLLKPYFSSYEEGLTQAKLFFKEQEVDIHFFEMPSERSKFHRMLVAVYSLFSRNPYSVNWLKSSELKNYLAGTMKEQHFDYVHVDTMGLIYALPDSASKLNVAINHHNAEHTMMARRAHKEKNWLLKTYLQIESKKIAKHDSLGMKIFKNHVVCSSEDATSLKALSYNIKTHLVPNGVRYLNHVVRKPIVGRLLFVGGLDWYPNQDAILFLLNEICPAFKNLNLSVQIDIVGKNPSDEILNAAKNYDFVKIHGYVDDINAIYSQAQAFICPLRDGGGTKLKVLDAMNHGLPVVGSSIAFEGIDIIDKEHGYLCDSPEKICSTIAELMNFPERGEEVGRRARKLIEEKYDSIKISREYSGYISNL